MFSLRKPTAAAVDEKIAAASRFLQMEPRFLTLKSGLKSKLPFLFAHDRLRSCIGHGDAAFHSAANAFQQWAAFDLGWVRVANSDSPMAESQIVAVEAHTLGLWSLNLSRVVVFERTSASIGFLYVTTSEHVEEGEERFLLTLDPVTGRVWYELEAVSRPRHLLARLGYPVTRNFQHRFARDSHRRMKEAAQMGRRDDPTKQPQTATLDA